VNNPTWSQEATLAKVPHSLTGFETCFSNIEILLIQRRDSLGFVDILRGKYSVNDLEYIKKQIYGMTDLEREKLCTRDFEELWAEMWGAESTDIQYKKDKEISKNKLLALRDGISLDMSGTKVTFSDLVRECTAHWTTPEWGFPKGRRNSNEKSDLDCAMREMKEETGLQDSDVQFISNLETLSETFFGTNRVHYCHKYFVMYVPDGSSVKYNNQNIHMKKEIGDIGWFSLNDALQKIRPENIEKREILLRVGNLLRNFSPLIHPS
jgi:8-oxo-dGTP pyrophosphatase MutT (NUDIX family)